jgi:ABC-type phosphate transport system permease subunit
MSLTEYEKKVRTHALLMGIAFLVIIPIGVLIARYLRTFTNRSVLLYTYPRMK